MISVRSNKSDFALEYTRIKGGLVEILYSDVIQRMFITRTILNKGFKILQTVDAAIVGQLYIEDREWRRQHHLYVPKKMLILPLETLEFEWAK